MTARFELTNHILKRATRTGNVVHEAEQLSISFDANANTGALDGTMHQCDIRPTTLPRPLARQFKHVLTQFETDDPAALPDLLFDSAEAQARPTADIDHDIACLQIELFNGTCPMTRQALKATADRDELIVSSR